MRPCAGRAPAPQPRASGRRDRRCVQTEVRRGDESGEEMQLLFAEYAMDFAMQAARHALLVALEAIRDEQRKGSAAE